MVTWQDNNPLAVAVEESVGQANEEFLCLGVLPRQLLVGVVCIRLHAIHEVAGDNTYRWPRDSWGLLVVLLEIPRERIEEPPVVRLITQVAMKSELWRIEKRMVSSHE